MTTRAPETKDFFAKLKAARHERRAACAAARPALLRLAEVLHARTGQSHTLRALLYSLWNGRPAPLIDVLTLDWPIRQDFCAVLLAFGYEDPAEQFFYDEIKSALQQVGLWDWFLEEGS